MKYKGLIYACLGATLIPIALWIGTGMHFANRFGECKSVICQSASDCYAEGDPEAKKWACKESTEGAQAEKKCYDTEFESFMDEEEAPAQDCFHFGLADGVAPGSGAFFGLAVVLFFLGRRRA